MYARAVADYIATLIAEPVARVGVARVGESYCGDDRDDAVPDVYAGLIPEKRTAITAQVTERTGGPADVRRSATRYEDPAYTLHLIGDDLAVLDGIADTVRTLDRTSHIRTAWGTINTFSVGPPSRRMSMRSPRYHLTLPIDAEIEVLELRSIDIGGHEFAVHDGIAVMTEEEFFATLGFTAEEVTVDDTPLITESGDGYA